MERTADTIDAATQLQEQANEQALARARAAGGRQSHPDFDGAHCLDCEVDLPPVRLAYGFIRCTPCQVVEDKRAKLRGR